MRFRGPGTRAALVVAVMALAIAACTPGEATPDPTDGTADASPPTVAALFTTPLEARDALESLDVFGQCIEPETLARHNYGYGATHGRAVTCFAVSADDYANASGARDRALHVIVLKEDWDKISGNFCDLDLDNWQIVTDYQTFFVWGQRVLDRGKSDGLWPEEVWPEDVVRVLGGEITTTDAFCKRLSGDQG